MKNLLELKRFQIKGSRVNQIYPLTEHSVRFGFTSAADRSM